MLMLSCLMDWSSIWSTCSIRLSKWSSIWSACKAYGMMTTSSCVIIMEHTHRVHNREHISVHTVLKAQRQRKVRHSKGSVEKRNHHTSRQQDEDRIRVSTGSCHCLRGVQWECVQSHSTRLPCGVSRWRRWNRGLSGSTVAWLCIR